MIARHMGKHVRGNPAISVENMTGAGSLVAANYLYKVAKPDGLVMSHFIGGLFLHQLLGKPGIEFDASQFEFLGTPMQDNFELGRIELNARMRPNSNFLARRCKTILFSALRNPPASPTWKNGWLRSKS